MITVALVTTRFLRQGPNRQLLYLIRNIDRNKVKPIVITLSPERDPSLLEEFKQENIEIIQLKLSTLKSLFLAKNRIRKIISKHEISIIHSFTYATRVEYVIHNINGVIKIATIRNSPKQSRIGYFGKIGGYLLYHLQMRFYKHMDKIVTCSNSIYELPELKHLNKVAIPNGIDLNMHGNLITSNQKINIRKKLGLQDCNELFLTISNATSIKNIEFLISYFIERENLTLIISGDINDEYKTLSSSSKNIILTGNIPNIQEYYKAVDYFISASYTEGLPNAVLESLLLGTPCILSDIPMHREILAQTSEIIGVLFVNNNVSDLDDKIKQLAGHININTSGDCNSFIINNYSASEMAKRYEDLYIKLTK